MMIRQCIVKCICSSTICQLGGSLQALVCQLMVHYRHYCLPVGGSLQALLQIITLPLPVVFSGCVNYFKGYWLEKILPLSLALSLYPTTIKTADHQSCIRLNSLVSAHNSGTHYRFTTNRFKGFESKCFNLSIKSYN